MTIKPVRFFPKETLWETTGTDKLPHGINKIAVTYKGDVYVSGQNLIWWSQNHFVDSSPVAVDQSFKGSQKRVHGHIGHALGGVGENQVRDVLLRSGQINPEDMLLPLLVKTITGHKELSDGILLHGNHAFILQVKTTLPTAEEEDVEWFRRRIRNNRSHALKQALFSHDLLKEHKRLEFATAAGTVRTINVQDYTWSYINVLAFNHIPVVKPARYLVPASSRHLPIMTISLKEWKDLFATVDHMQAMNFLRRACHSTEPEFFGYNLFSLFQMVDSGVYSKTNHFITAFETLLSEAEVNKKFILLIKKLDALTVEQLAMLSQAYENYQGKSTRKTIGLTPHLKVVFSSSTPGIEYKLHGAVLHF